MRKNLRSFALVLVLGLAALPALASAATDLTPLERQVRHELVLLPYHNLFDNLEFQVRGMHLTPETPTYSMRGCGGLPADAGGV